MPAVEELTGSANDRKSLRQHAYEEIRRQIVDLRLAPGSRLVERDLAAELERVGG